MEWKQEEKAELPGCLRQQLVNPNHVTQKPARNALCGEASMICPPPVLHYGDFLDIMVIFWLTTSDRDTNILIVLIVINL